MAQSLLVVASWPRWLAIALAIGFLSAASAAERNRSLESPDGGEVRALVIGIDGYHHVRQLKGAAADARDLEQALRNSGTQDVTALIDDQVSRAAILSAIDGLIARSGPRDLVVLTIAGHGAQEPERVKGSHPDGLEDVFLLTDFDVTPAGSEQRIFGSEFNHLIKQIEARGARVLFIADTCYGGGMARAVDPRSQEMSFRQVPTYRLTVDSLKPIATTADEMLTELDFNRSAFLAAVDRQTKAPEVKIPGVSGYRGALSYAVARAVEGSADTDGDGKTTLKELFTNVRQVVYQLSDQRQNIVTTTPPSVDLNRSVVFEFAGAAAAVASAHEAPAPSPAESVLPVGVDRPIKIASLDGKSEQFAGLTRREADFEIVRPTDNPDLIWDPASHDVIAWGDVVAYRVDPSDLSSVIDRAAAIRELKSIATKVPQSLKVMPDDSLHRRGDLVQLGVSDVAGRALVLFTIAGDGTVQQLYPIASDPTVIEARDFRFPVRVREPFGGDQLVAITSQQPMPALEQALQQLSRRRAALEMIKMVQRYAPADVRIGSAGVFTAP
jgi:hypothetical protein